MDGGESVFGGRWTQTRSKYLAIMVGEYCSCHVPAR